MFKAITKCGNVSTHSRPKAAAQEARLQVESQTVSTHSRPKAAANCRIKRTFAFSSFNTQPPEGGCLNPSL